MLWHGACSWPPRRVPCARTAMSAHLKSSTNAAKSHWTTATAPLDHGHQCSNSLVCSSEVHDKVTCGGNTDQRPQLEAWQRSQLWSILCQPQPTAPTGSQCNRPMPLGQPSSGIVMESKHDHFATIHGKCSA